MTMGEKILKLRKARGWSQEELAFQLQVTRQAISRWESDSAKPDADNIVALCGLFGVSADYLLNVAQAASIPAQIEQKPAGDKSGLYRLVTGITFLIMGILMLLALTLVSAIDPWTYVKDQHAYDGIAGYVLAHDMQWFVISIAVLTVGGMILLLWKYVRVMWNKLTEYLKK